MELKKETIGGVACTVEVDTYGRFTVKADASDNINASVGSGRTLDEAISAARREVGKRKVKVAIDFITPAGEHGRATGKHSGTGNVLATIGSESMQLTDYRMRQAFPADIDPDIVERYTQAKLDERDAQKRLNELAAHLIDLDKVVEEALRAKIREQDEAQRVSAQDDVRRD